jgi:hypothetical protein
MVMMPSAVAAAMNTNITIKKRALLMFRSR